MILSQCVTNGNTDFNTSTVQPYSIKGQNMDGLEVVAWDIYERRIYGAPGEKRHRVLWVEHYRLADGSTPDLDWMLENAKKGAIDGGSITIHVRPMYAAKDANAN